MAIQAYHLSIPSLKSEQGLSVRALDIEEAIGEPYRLTLTVTTPASLDLLQLLDQPAAFTVSPVDAAALADGLPFAEATAAPARRWAGVVRTATRLSFSADETTYEIGVAPRLAKLADVIDTRLYQNVDVPALIEQVLREDIGLIGHDFRILATRAYPVHEHCMRWKESGLDFLRRWCEASGLFFYFTQQDEREVVVFADDASHYLKAQAVHLFRPDAGLESHRQESIQTLRVTATPVGGHIERLDYNYRTSAGADLLGTQQGNPRQSGLTGRDYQWGAHQKAPAQGQDASRLQYEINLARQIVATGEANVLAFAPAQVFRPDGPKDPLAEFGWVITAVRHRAARREAWRSDYTAIPAERVYRLPQETPKPTIPGTLPARITSPSRYTNAYLDENGRYRVQFLFDQDARQGKWPPAGSSRLMRLARPYAGDTYGFHFPLIDGTEVQVAFQSGDIDRPYLLTSLHDQTKPDLVTNKNHTRNVVRTPANNKLRMEDRDGQEHIKLATEYGKSQLNLGHLVDVQRQKRGEGFELRTDEWGALRAGKGILISANSQGKAAGAQLDMQNATSQLEAALRQAEALKQASEQAKAELAEIQEQRRLMQESLAELKQAAVLLSAPAGVAAVTPTSIQLAAGDNLIANTGGNADFSVMKRFTVAAGQAISLCAHSMGMKLFANKGPLQIQAQTDSLEASAQKNIAISTVEGDIVIQGKKSITLVDGGGAYIQLQGGVITLGAPQPIQVKSTLSINGSGHKDVKLPNMAASNVCVECLQKAAKSGAAVVPQL